MIDNVEVELLLGKHNKRHKKTRYGPPGSGSESDGSTSEGDDSSSEETSSTSSSDDGGVYSPEHTNSILSHRNTMIEKARATAAAAHKQMLIDTMMATRLAVSGKAIAELQQQQQHGTSLYVGQKQFHFDSGDADPSTNSKPTTPQLTNGRLLPPISAEGPLPLASGKQLSSESPTSPFGTMSSPTSIRHSRPQYHLKADLGPILPPKLLPKGATLGEKGLRPEIGSGVRGPISPSASREGKRPPHQLPPFLVRSAPSLVASSLSSSAPVAPSSAPTVSPKTGALGSTTVLLTPIAQANLGASPLSRALAASSAPPMSSLVALSPISPMSPISVQGGVAAVTQLVAGGKQGARVTFTFQEKQGTPTTTQPLVLHPPVPATAPQQQLPPTPAIAGSLRTLRGARELLITMEIDELKTGHGPKGQ